MSGKTEKEKTNEQALDASIRDYKRYCMDEPHRRKSESKHPFAPAEHNGVALGATEYSKGFEWLFDGWGGVLCYYTKCPRVGARGGLICPLGFQYQTKGSSRIKEERRSRGERRVRCHMLKLHLLKLTWLHIFAPASLGTFLYTVL